jgi:DHA2 family multidrug resistance protein
MSGSAATFEEVPHRAIITICLMIATLMQALDSTIANVALPYMQGSLSATYDEITWVLTSYVTAAAIMTAPVGWMATRFGRKRLFLTCLIGFTIASMMCGAAQSLPQMVVFRLLQGVFGAALVPLSQSTMLDIYPPAMRGSAMAIWGMGVMVGPILGPTLGGYLTEMYNWRWVFYVNLPFGILAVAGLLVFMPKTTPTSGMRFDWIGFGVLALGIGALQMMLDRGQDQDWFNSTEIIVEAVLAGLGIYLFTVHMFTAPKPFLPPVIFTDRNFVVSVILMFAVGMVLLASSALMAPWLQNLSNFPVETAGLVLAPRGIGTMAAMLIGGRLSQRFDPRLFIALGVLLLCGSLWSMTGWTPDVSQGTVAMIIVIQGAGLGFVFIPLQVIAFATLAPQMRADGEHQQHTDDEVHVLEDRRRQKRSWRGEHVDDEQVDAEPGQHRLDDDLGGVEPVLILAAIQHHLQRADADRQDAEADPVEPHALRRRGLRHENDQACDSQDAERQVDVEHPAPVVHLRQVAAERGAEDRADHHAHAPDRHGRAAHLGRVDVQHRRLRQRHQGRAEHALQQPEDHHLRQRLRRTAQHRGDGETDKAGEE